MEKAESLLHTPTHFIKENLEEAKVLSAPGLRGFHNFTLFEGETKCCLSVRLSVCYVACLTRLPHIRCAVHCPAKTSTDSMTLLIEKLPVEELNDSTLSKPRKLLSCKKSSVVSFFTHPHGFFFSTSSRPHIISHVIIKAQQQRGFTGPQKKGKQASRDPFIVITAPSTPSPPPLCLLCGLSVCPCAAGT